MVTISLFDDGRCLLTAWGELGYGLHWITKVQAAEFAVQNKRTGITRTPGWLANNEGIGVDIEYYADAHIKDVEMICKKETVK